MSTTDETLESPSHPTVAASAEQWVAEELPPKARVWEIGRAFKGCSDEADVVARQRGVLDDMIAKYGDDISTYDQIPEIRSVHNHEATVGVLDFGRRITVNRQPCVWAAYARVFSETTPADWYVPEGVRIPNEDQ